MSKEGTLTKNVQESIHARAALLFCVVCEAEGNGASPQVIERHFKKGLEEMRAALSETCPPERVETIVSELLDACNTYQSV